MHFPQAHRCVVLLMLAGLACNTLTPGSSEANTSSATSPSVTAQPTQTTESTATFQPTALPPTPDPFPIFDAATAPVSGLNANLNLRIQAGEWTLEEGLVQSLQLLVGETTDNDINPDGRPITSYEGFGIINRAAAYIQDGSDAATKTELQRLLNLIFPVQAALDRVSVPASPAGSNNKPHLASLRQQDVACETLWAAGFDDAAPATCLEYRSATINGNEYRLYTPAAWPTGDPRRALADPIMQAVQDSVTTFSAYGPLPPATLVFTLLPDSVPAADAAAWMAGSGAACQIALFPAITESSVEVIQQTVAHEMFHCFQYQRNWAQVANYEAGAWWIEGTAEYFGNVVYPTVNAESQFWPGFDHGSIRSPLLDMDYENVVFFQYLANQTGNEGVLSLIDNMPTSGGRGAQLSAFSGYSGIEDLFHAFAQAYMDRDIADTSGAAIAVNPGADRIREFAASHTETVSTQPFLVARAFFMFPEGTHHTLTEDDIDGIHTAAESFDSSGAWGTLPSEVAAGCGDRIYVYIATVTSNSTSNPEPKVTSDVEDRENACDPCLVGSWQVDVDSHVQASLAIANAEGIQLQSVSGAITALFTEAGQLSFAFENYIVNFTLERGDTHVDSTLTMNGLWQGDWYSEGDGSGTFYALNPTSYPAANTHSVFTIPGGSFEQDNADAFAGLGSGPALYQCQGDTLLVDAFTPALGRGQFVPWYKIETSP